MSKGKLVIIDGNSLLYRAFYALPDLTTSKGEPTNAVYGFTTMLMKILEDEEPEFLGIAFDSSAPTFRHELFQDYKGHRSKMPDELVAQLPVIRELVDAFDFKHFEMDGFEADDLIGTMSYMAAQDGYEVLIVSSDRDLLQLIDPNVKVLLVKRGVSDTVCFDEDMVQEEYGVSPIRLIDMKGLTGDKSDNIPGVPGIGEKTSKTLLDQGQTIEELLENLDRVQNKRQRRLLQEYGEQALLSKKLATIVRDAPIGFQVEDCRLGTPDVEQVLQLFDRLEFISFKERLIERYGLSSASNEEVAQVPQTKDILIDSSKVLKMAVEEARTSGRISLEMSADGLGSMTAKPLGIAFAPEPNVRYYLPLTVLSDESRELMASLLEDPKVDKICHDGKDKLILARRAGFDIKPLASDIMIASYLVDSGISDNEMEKLTARYLGRELEKGRSYRPLAKGAEVSIEDICGHVGDILLIDDMLQERMHKEGLWELFSEVEMPLIEVLTEMEMTGIILDKEGIDAISNEWDEKLQYLIQVIHTLAMEEFNVNSPKQLSKILFEKLGLPVIKKTKTGYSTNSDVLERLKPHHPIASVVIEYRQFVKLKSTYADALPNLINPETGRIHTTFNQAITATGRLSSAEPNLQNIPVRTEEGRRIRKVFVPAPGCIFLSADYSQIELRVLAHVSGDENLTDSFLKGQDVHTRTASEVFDIPLEYVNQEQRDKAKAVNFGIIYGISPFGLAKGIGVGQKEAEEYIKSYFKKYSGVKTYIDNTVEQAYKDGYVTTLLNRKRYLPELKNRNAGIRNFGERTAINTPIQGTAADIIKMAMVELLQRLKAEGYGAKLLLQVHDELLLEVPLGEVEEVATMVRDIMENVMELRVPLKVDLKAGSNWADLMKDYKI